MKEKTTVLSADLIDEAYRLASHAPQAEIVAGDQATWLAITVTRERVAAAHLIGRRFMIYLPEIEIIERGRKRIEFMFPGHLFVFVWGVDRHWWRIKACPGVTDILGAVSDHVIHAVQVVENECYPLVPSIKIGKKRRWRRNRIEQTPDYANEIVSVRMWSAFADELRDDLDSGARNRLLRRALSLA